MINDNYTILYTLSNDIDEVLHIKITHSQKSVGPFTWSKTELGNLHLKSYHVKNEVQVHFSYARPV